MTQFQASVLSVPSLPSRHRVPSRFIYLDSRHEFIIVRGFLCIFSLCVVKFISERQNWRPGKHINLTTKMFGVAVFCVLLRVCLCDNWPDSYIEAYKESEGAVFDGPYPLYSRQPPMSMQNTTAPVSMMPFLLQLIMIAAKIMLKFTIFKIIVKFIAVVCFFLFIPTLRLPRLARSDNKMWIEAWEEMEKTTVDSLNAFVQEALKKYKEMFT